MLEEKEESLRSKMNINEICEEFFHKEWGNEKVRLHSSCMIEACLNMIKDTSLDPEIFIIAGWIHDIGRKTDVEKHPQISAELLNKFLDENKSFSDKKEILLDCILNHKRSGKPQTVYGMIFQAADKASLYNNRWIASKFSFS